MGLEGGPELDPVVERVDDAPDLLAGLVALARDHGKRPLMGEAAAKYADLVVVTDDNPRSENPAAVRAALLEGASAGPGVTVEVAGRRDAIAHAVKLAHRGDTVVVAGKGHEQGQEIDDVVHPFDDRAVLRELIEGTG